MFEREWVVLHVSIFNPTKSLSQLIGFLPCSNTAWDVIFVLYCYSPIRTGGIAFTVS